MLRIRTSTALVTGASAGVGAMLARELARRGVARLVLVARRRDRLEALARELAPIDVVVEAVDLADEAALSGLIARHPDVDILVNCAGVGGGGLFLDQPAASASSLVALNCVAPMRLMRAHLPGMVARGQGGVLNVGSVAGLVPHPTGAVYGASKAFLNQLSEAVRLELRGKGVHLTNLSPGPIQTEFFAVGYARFRQPPGPLFLSPERVAREGIEGLIANKSVVTPAFWIRWPMALGVALPRFLLTPFLLLYARFVTHYEQKTPSSEPT